MSLFRIVWVVPEERGGIRSYSEGLWPSVKKVWQGDAVDPIYALPTPEDLDRLQPDLIHVQHEFGLFGSKTPGFYRFPRWVRSVRKVLPRVRIVATAHNVLGPDYRYSYANQSWQIPIRFAANHSVLPLMRKTWLMGTWGRLNGVIVHSGLQKSAIEASGCPRVAVIPHYVYRQDQTSAGMKHGSNSLEIVVFGFICPDKGQDIAIRALAAMKTPARLVLAGGVRREKDQAYLESCRKLAKELGVSNRVDITGFVPSEKLHETYQRATLVLAPFRETSGSGSLAQAFARGCPVLASDLPLNKEILRRTEGTIELFRSEDPKAGAEALDRLMNDAEARRRLSEQGLIYAAENGPEKIAEMHLKFYKNLPGNLF